MRILQLAVFAIAVVMAFIAPSLAHSLDEVDQDLRDKDRYFQPVDSEAPGFTLQDADGRIVRLSDLRGKVVVLNFVYTNCPDVCPLHAERIAELQTMINQTPMKEMVEFVTITTDPRHDTGSVLGDYGMEARQQAAEQNELTAVLTQRHDEIFNDPGSPVGANPTGDATLAEFFDYNCPYCRRAMPVLDELEQVDKGLRLVLKEYPILGPGSVFAARAALASQKQGKYLAFHKAMMTYQGRITETTSLEVAAEIGLDVERLKKDIEDPAIDETIKRNIALGQALRISGTPAFVTGKEILLGLADANRMKQLIASALGG